MHLIVIPVLTGPHMTARCIDSALAQDVDDVKVLVIDNGSRDCGPMLRSYGGRITLVSYSMPRSLNVVWNMTLDLAFRSLRLDHALVINNDTVLRPDTYRLLRDDGGLFVTGVSVDTMQAMKHADVTSKSPHPGFSCFLIRSECWNRVGRFDERYWAYASDGDMHLRMDRMGIDAYALAVPFYHEVSGTLKHVDDVTRDQLCKRADADRETFRQTYGFSIGSPEYYDAFRKLRENRYAATGRLD